MNDESSTIFSSTAAFANKLTYEMVWRRDNSKPTKLHPNGIDGLCVRIFLFIFLNFILYVLNKYTFKNYNSTEQFYSTKHFLILLVHPLRILYPYRLCTAETFG